LDSLVDALGQLSGPKVSIRAIRDYLYEARVAATKADSFRAVAALDGALRVIERVPRTEPGDTRKPKPGSGTKECNNPKE
jgi:hypothetical protein